MRDAEVRSFIHTVPTFVGRKSGYFDLACTVIYALICWNFGIPLWLAGPGGLLVVLWALTGPAASDVRGVGDTAAALRSLLGQRRVNEWGLALWHFYVVAVWPKQKRTLRAFYGLSRRRITRWRASATVVLAWKPWRAFSWGFRSRSN